MTSSDELIAALLLDGKGGGRSLGWAEVANWRHVDGVLWIHLHRDGEGVHNWLERESGVEEWVAEALLAEETRPRVTVAGDCLLMIMRGVNLNPEADPEDMVSLRMWFERDRVISTRRRHVKAVADVREAIVRGEGPTDAGDLLATLVERLVDRMGPIIGGIEDAVDDLEERVLTEQKQEQRTTLATLRRQAITLRRYIAPQREAMSQLYGASVSWVAQSHRIKIREVNDRITRYVEDLDSVRERAAVTHEELAARLSEQMNSTMYRLTVVATVFLPLGLLTGLLGINVGGIPGADYPWAFGIVSTGLIAIGVGEIVYFRRRRLL